MVKHIGAVFEHDCPLCQYIGTASSLVPPFPPSLVFRGQGYFLVGKVDFYICDGGLSRLYVARLGEGLDNCKIADKEAVDDWSLVEIVRRSDDTTEEEFLRMAVKSIRVLDRLSRLDLGYAVIRLADKPTSPFVLTLPTLLPHEQEIAHRVAMPLIQGFQGNARDNTAMRDLDTRIEHGLQKQANVSGYITRWNKGSLFVPAESQEAPKDMVQ